MSKVKLYSVPEANELIYDACIRTLNKAKAKQVRDIKQLRKELLSKERIEYEQGFGIGVVDVSDVVSIFAKYLEEK